MYNRDQYYIVKPVNDKGLCEILVYAEKHLEYAYNPRDSDSEEFQRSIDYLLSNKEI